MAISMFECYFELKIRDDLEINEPARASLASLVRPTRDRYQTLTYSNTIVYDYDNTGTNKLRFQNCISFHIWREEINTQTTHDRKQSSKWLPISKIINKWLIRVLKNFSGIIVPTNDSEHNDDIARAYPKQKPYQGCTNHRELRLLRQRKFVNPNIWYSRLKIYFNAVFKPVLFWVSRFLVFTDLRRVSQTCPLTSTTLDVVSSLKPLLSLNGEV